MIVGATLGIVTFILLRTEKIYSTRKIVLITFSILVWAGFFVFLFYIGLGDVIKWVQIHVPVYYSDMPVVGGTYVPCYKNLPELFLGLAFSKKRSVTYSFIFDLFFLGFFAFEVMLINAIMTTKIITPAITYLR